MLPYKLLFLFSILLLGFTYTISYSQRPVKLSYMHPHLIYILVYKTKTHLNKP